MLTRDELADQALLAQVGSGNYPSFVDIPDSQLTNLARSLCTDLRDGYDPISLAWQLKDGIQGVTEVEAAAFVGASMGAYCPRYRSAW